MNCDLCGDLIHPDRIELLPDTRTCVRCSTEEPIVGFMIYNHKTAEVIMTSAPRTSDDSKGVPPCKMKKPSRSGVSIRKCPTRIVCKASERTRSEYMNAMWTTTRCSGSSNASSVWFGTLDEWRID